MRCTDWLFALVRCADWLHSSIAPPDWPVSVLSRADWLMCVAGRDMIGVAKTGSGKTLAFVLPMMRHIADQHELEDTDGPIGESA